MAKLMNDVQAMGQDAPGAQIEKIAKFYIPLLEYNYEDPVPRAADIEHLGQIASRYDTRKQFLTEIVLDPPHQQEILPDRRLKTKTGWYFRRFIQPKGWNGMPSTLSMPLTAICLRTWQRVPREKLKKN